MRNIARNGFLTLLAVLIAAWAIMPHDWLPGGFPRIGKVAKGRDLAGGVTLVYQVDIQPGEPAGEIIPKMIDVLKNRIDPTGQMEISIVQQGNDRIEITMPLPGERVKRLRADFEQSLTELGSGWMNADEFERLLRLPPQERTPALERLATAPARRDLVSRAAEARDAANAARAALDAQRARVEAARAKLAEMEALPEGERNEILLAALRQGLDEEERRLDEPSMAVARANLVYEEAREAAMKAAISPVEVRRALTLSPRPMSLRDGQTGQRVSLPSPRERAMERLKTTHPGSETALQNVIAAWERYQAERSTLDDPADLKRILRGAGVLNFRITVQPGAQPEEVQLRQRLREAGPRAARTDRLAWYKINRLENWVDSVADLERVGRDPQGFFAGRGYVVEEWDGEYWMLAHRGPGMQLTEGEGDWQLTQVFRGQDQIGRPAINFAMDALGAQRLGRLTEPNIGRQMAILLDDEVYTAPTLQSRIAGSGQITGSFSNEEINYIVRVLSAGSLQAKLSPEPISESTLGPSLGQDNLEKGMRAGIVSFFLVAGFMVFYYFLCGGVAVIALGINALLLVGAMALQHAAFTLPGIAGIALTFGIAVDANVLVYERIREELLKGSDVKTAVRLGYQRALSAIVDGNLTNLIVCVVLGFMGTQEIKGFAITLGVGVLTTLFSQLVVTRTVFAVLTEYVGIRKLRMLPMVVPAIDRALTPKIDWIRLRWVFAAISVVWAGMGVAMIVKEGSNLLDTEFRGGTAVTVQLKRDDAGVPMVMDRAEAERRVRTIPDAVADSAAAQALAPLRFGSVLVMNPEADGFRSNEFRIKTVVDNREGIVQSAIIRAFEDVVDSQPRLNFLGDEAGDVRQAPVYPVISAALGDSIDRPEYRNDVADTVGGVAIVVENLAPRPTLQSLESRIANLRQQPEFVQTLGRPWRIVILEGTPEAVQTAAVLVRDPEVNFLSEETIWRTDLADPEWRLVRESLTAPTTLASVQSFSPAIAATFRAQAVVSVVLASLLIIMYVWIRFNSIRYSLAAIVATLHDCLVAIGMVAIAEVLYNNFPGVAQPLGLMPFKFDLNLVAAVLTILGYSLNDTIVIMDRIRENRGKLPYTSRSVINLSINQTLSRTVITSGTTMVSVLVLYILAGPGVREFAYALLIGIVAGTFSSFGIAAPMVWSGPDRNRPEPGTEAGAGAALGVPGGGNGHAAAPAIAPASR